jgi:hypothetical protein
MPGEFYFMAIGGLGVTLAGFAGLIAALHGPEGPVAAWRVRNIVFQGFSVTLVGFATVALYGLTQDVTLTVRLASAVMVVVTLAARWGETRPGPAWPNERTRRGYILTELVVAIAIIVNIALASVGYLQLLLLFLLSVPAGTFARSVRDATRGTDADSGSHGSAPPQT